MSCLRSALKVCPPILSLRADYIQIWNKLNPTAKVQKIFDICKSWGDFFVLL